MRTRFGTFASAVTAVTVLGVGASACGGSSSKTSGSASTSAPAGTSASTSGASSPAQDAAAAKQAMAPDLVAPTKLTVNTPLPNPAPAGKTIVYLQCDNTACTLTGNGVAAAAQVLGWTYKAIPFKLADPSTLITGLDSALQFKPYFVMETGVPEAAFAGEVAKYRQAGVGIAVQNAGSPNLDSTLLGYTNAQNYSKAAAEMLANWFISDSAGTGHAAWITLPSVESSTAETADFKAFVQAHCSKCSVSSVQVSLAQLASGGIASSMVSSVQADPTIKYIFAPVGSATIGLRAALNAAGFQDVKIAGVAGSYQNFLNIASGAESAWVSEGTNIKSFNLVDAALHGTQGPSAQYQSDIYGPLVLVTKDNLATLGGVEAAKATGAFELPSNYVDLFKALWQVK